MKSNTLNSVLLAAILLVGVFIASYLGSFRTLPAIGSVTQGNDYYSTSTRTANGVAMAGTQLIKGSSGALGSVVITGAAVGSITFYDATTSDVTKRAATMSSTSIQIADVTFSLVAGTYVFDVAYGRGLLAVLNSTAPTTTITYR